MEAGYPNNKPALLTGEKIMPNFIARNRLGKYLLGSKKLKPLEDKKEVEKKK